MVEADLPERPSIEIEEGLYRIAQEALHNIVKHAGARQVTVEVTRVSTASGCGSPTTGGGSTRPRSPTATSAWPGCASAPNASAGGSAVESGRGRGTTIEVIVPDVRRAG